MSLGLKFGDNFAAKQDVGADVVLIASGDDRLVSGSIDDYKVLAQSTLTTSAVAYLTPGSGHDFIVSNIKITNPGGSTRIVTLYFDANGTTYDATTQWGSPITLAPGASAE